MRRGRILLHQSSLYLAAIGKVYLIGAPELPTGQDNDMKTRPRKCMVYLLRLWQVEENDRHVWRASLEESDTGERRGFSSLVLLMKFLGERTQSDDDFELILLPQQK